MGTPYEFREYAIADLDAVAEFQRFLLGSNIQSNRSYLDWKYHRNPQDSTPRAIVAVKGGEIVGFRGFIPSLWWYSNHDEPIAMLALADTCVHPDHRRRGLFSSMTNEALELLFPTRYTAIVNFSTSAKPAPGYLKLGWKVFGWHGHRVRYSVNGIVRKLLKVETFEGKRFEAFQRSDGVVVDTQPRPEVMAKLATNNGRMPGRLTFYRDIDFYRWRYHNPRECYRFAWSFAGNDIDAYIAIRVSSPYGDGAIVDYAESTPGRIIKLCKLLIKDDIFSSLSAWCVAPRSVDSAMWKKAGLIDLQRFRRLLRPNRSPMPLLIRPLGRVPIASDWYIMDCNLLDIDSWRLMEICSDGS